MMLTERQKRFLDYVGRENKKDIDVNDRNQMVKMIVINLFEMYINFETRSQRRETAWLIFSLKDDIKKKVKLWHLIEPETFKELIQEKIDNRTNIARAQQERRHEKRDDFALSHEQWEEVKSYFDYKCAYCKNPEKLTFDHFYPFSKGGDFMKGNIIPSCSSCNSSKNDKLFENWYPEQTFYNQRQERKILKYINSNKQLTLL